VLSTHTCQLCRELRENTGFRKKRKFSYDEEVGCYIAQYLFLYWNNSFSAGNEKLIFSYSYRNSGCSNDEQIVLLLGPDLLLEFGFCFVKEIFCVTAKVSMHNNDFETFICEKVSSEDIED